MDVLSHFDSVKYEDDKDVKDTNWNYAEKVGIYRDIVDRFKKNYRWQPAGKRERKHVVRRQRWLLLL